MFSGLIIFFSITAMATSDMTEYFPKATDLSKVTWAHAVNNKTLLQDALSSDANMLEADVSFGKTPSDSADIPIMAHPPDKVSDLSLKTFLIDVNNHNMNNSNPHKGVKLDFKSIEAFNASVGVLKENLKGGLKPVWLNADILSGPVNATSKPVDAKQFLTSCNNEFNNITLSIGWTTNYNISHEGEGYTEQQINNMIETIKLYQVKHPITFPVRAGLAAESYDEIKTLIDNVNDSTLTIWSSENDIVNVKNLRNLILKIGLNKVYIDVPKNLSDQLDLPSAGSKVQNFGLFAVMLSSILSLILSTTL